MCSLCKIAEGDWCTGEAGTHPGGCSKEPWGACPPHTAKVSFSVPAELFSPSIRKRDNWLHPCERYFDNTHTEAYHSSKMDPRTGVHIKCQTPYETQTGSCQTFAIANLPALPYSDSWKHSTSNYEACENTDKEPHPAINFKRKLTNECAQRGTQWLGEGQGSANAFTARSLF